MTMVSFSKSGNCSPHFLPSTQSSHHLLVDLLSFGAQGCDLLDERWRDHYTSIVIPYYDVSRVDPQVLADVHGDVELGRSRECVGAQYSSAPSEDLGSKLVSECVRGAWHEEPESPFLVSLEHHGRTRQ